MIRRLFAYLDALGWTGPLVALRAKLSGRGLVHAMNAPGCRAPVHLRVPSSDVPTYKQVFVDREYDFHAATPPAVIVDAGANIGLAAVAFANRFPDARIIAIEPEAGNFALLTRNTAAYPNVVPVRAALWHTVTDLDLIDPGLGYWGFMTGAAGAADALPGVVRDRVPTTTIDRLLADYGLARIDILKIDIEGAEREVFMDTTSWLPRVDALIVELHERMKTGCNRSFYLGSPGFAHEWSQGEHVYLSRGNILPARHA